MLKEWEATFPWVSKLHGMHGQGHHHLAMVVVVMGTFSEQRADELVSSKAGGGLERGWKQTEANSKWRDRAIGRESWVSKREKKEESYGGVGMKNGTGGGDFCGFWKKLWDLVLETKQSLQVHSCILGTLTFWHHSALFLAKIWDCLWWLSMDIRKYVCLESSTYTCCLFPLFI